MLRPEQIRVNPDSAQGPHATVTACTYYGPETLVHVQLRDDAVSVSAKVFSHEAPRPGDVVALSVSGPVVVFP
jgi:ABC-type Fe3+/spermidine/putrescine transport system ATPase subunit